MRSWKALPTQRRDWWEPDFPHWNPSCLYWETELPATATLRAKLRYRSYHEIRYRTACWGYLKQYVTNWIKDNWEAVGGLAAELAQGNGIDPEWWKELRWQLSWPPFGKGYRLLRREAFSEMALEYWATQRARDYVKQRNARAVLEATFALFLDPYGFNNHELN